MVDNDQKPILIICGPTASGKSALALDVARQFNGLIINADSMQIYRQLRILTSRPTTIEETQIPHRLFGIADLNDVFSAGRWRDLAVREIEQAHIDGILPIICGGTGLYIKALMEGLSYIPPIPDKLREQIRLKIHKFGNGSAYRELMQRDPKTAARLNPGDTQRIARALEVIEASGRSISEWQQIDAKRVSNDWQFWIILLAPERKELNSCIEIRFLKMLELGALDEVASIKDFSGDLPLLKAIGVNELQNYLNGNLRLSEAIEQVQTATRKLAKRQTTWFKNQIVADLTINSQYSERFRDKIFSFIRLKVLSLPG